MKSKILIICLLLVVVAGCKDSNEPGDVSPITELNDLINSVATFPPPSPYGKNADFDKGSLWTTAVFVEDGEWYKTNKIAYKFTRPFEAIINLNANQSDIYPGSIVQGKYLTEGRAVSIGDNFARKPITLTMANGGSSIQINNPTYAEISTAMNDLVAEQKPMPAVLNYEIVNMYSSEQALMEFGLDIDWGFLTASGMYSNSTTDNKNSVLLCFKQLYYTMSIGNNRGATDLFATNVDVEQLKTKTGEGNPLCVINEVDYGRMILVKVSSTESYEEITKTIKAGITFLGSGKFQTTNSVFNSTYDFKAHIIGGKASDAAKVVDGIGAVFDIIKRGADYADGNPGFPVNYRATYLRNNEPVLGGKTISYVEPTTIKWGNDFSFTFEHITLNKLDNNITSIKNPKIRAVLYRYIITFSGEGYYDTLLDYEHIYRNQTFKSGDNIYILKTGNIVIYPELTDIGGYRFPFSTHASVELWTENGKRISWAYYTIDKEKITDWFHTTGGWGSFYAIDDGEITWPTTLFVPDNTTWESKFNYTIKKL